MCSCYSNWDIVSVGGKDNSGFWVVGGVWGYSDNAPRICAVTFPFCTGGRCCHWTYQSAQCELLYELVLMSETIEGLRDKFLKWKEAFERKEGGFWEEGGRPLRGRRKAFERKEGGFWEEGGRLLRGRREAFERKEGSFWEEGGKLLRARREAFERKEGGFWEEGL